MQKPITLNIDTTNNSPVYPDKNIRQGDTLNMTINVYQGSSSLSLTGQTIHIIIKRSSGFSIEMETGNSRLSVSGNVITAIFKDEYLCTDAIGETKGEIILIDSEGESLTNQFIFEVQESLATDVIIKNADTLDTFIGIKELIDSYNANADNLATQNTLALQHENNLTQLNSDSANLANRLETDKANGILVAERLEDDIDDGTTLAIRLENDISNGTITNNNIITSIANANVLKAEIANMNFPLIQSYIDLMNIMLSGMTITDENNVDITDEFDVSITM